MPNIRKPARKIVEADRIRVVVRVRPLSGEEAAASPTVALPFDSSRNCCGDMNFDRVLDVSASQADAFEQVVGTVDYWLQGFNGAILAYGQTGSGKTHTMMGPDGGKHALSGVIPQTVRYALQHIDEEQADFARCGSGALSQMRLVASYVELYNDEIRDLLAVKGSAVPVALREKSSGQLFLEGVVETVVRSVEDLMAVVRLGAERRATGRTNMNAHSSRSHAILRLELQHRWKDATCTNPKLFHCKNSVLQLVDLAGSEYAKRTGNEGAQLKESIAINSGLFALGNVIAALAGHRDRRIGDHIPYRDSLLTRVLQPSIGGDAKTTMVVCCSPAASNVEESLGALRYANAARFISNRAVLHIEDVEAEANPMDDDINDPDGEFNRRSVWLDVGEFGDIYCRCLGDPSGELLLFVHGSGPTNSSTWWNSLIFELAVRTIGRNYFFVAIDCPGYGRSRGDRQVIRSYPGTFLSAVVSALGKSEAKCLIGSSQGACAVFNAVLEVPNLSQYVTVMDPVGHDVFRYRAIRQPSLVIFDTEDDGHPVKVGRWMRDNLPRCIYHEFASSKEPYWHCDHMATEMIQMFDRFPSRSVGGGGALGVDESLFRLAGGLVAWCEHQRFGEPCKAVQPAGPLPVPSTWIATLDPLMQRQTSVFGSADDEASVASHDVAGSVWIAEVDPISQRVFYTNDATLEVTWKRPRFGTVQAAAAVDEYSGAARPPAPSKTYQQDLFDDKPVVAAPVEKVPETAEEAEQRLNAERQEVDCLRCGEPLWKPVRHSTCRHAVCALCHWKSSRYTLRCSVCGIAMSVKSIDDVQSAAHQSVLATRVAPDRAAFVDAEVKRRDALSRIIIEYGNSAVGSSGAAYCVEAYLKAVKVEKGSASVVASLSASRAVSRVAFNINPDFPKAAVKVLAPPFVLQRTMALAFTCDMFVTLDASLNLPMLTVPYTIHHEPMTTLRAVIYVAPPGSGPTSAAAAKGRGAAAKEVTLQSEAGEIEVFL